VIGLVFSIRPETTDEHEKVNEIVYKAFAESYGACAGRDVLEYFKKVRKKDTFVPELSLVALLKSGEIAGQITLYKTDIITDTGRSTQLVLSPISVLPEYSKQGIARELITFALDKAAKMGYAAVFLDGSPAFYEKFGFEPSYRHGIIHKKGRVESCMVCILNPAALDGVSGSIYHD
jgi:predicted N-acetyltransferase YhbS